MRMTFCYNLFFMTILAMFAFLAVTSCEHRLLEEPTGRNYVRIYFDEHIKNVTYGFYAAERQETEFSTPNIMRVALYNSLTGKQQFEGFLRGSGEDERGRYVDGSIPAFDGEYNLLISAFNVRSTFIRNEYVYDQVEAYTNPLSDALRQSLVSVRSSTQPSTYNILYQPNHFFVKSEEQVKFKRSYDTDTIRDSKGDFLTASSIVKTYYLQINVKGAEYVSSASGYLTGLAGSVNLVNRTLNESDQSGVYFQLNSNHLSRRSDISQAYTSFNTFGKIPSVDAVLTVVFEFKTTYGTVQIEEMELTDLFESDTVRNEQWIIIDKVIEIEPGDAGGGMQPSVGTWGTVNADITI